MEAAVKQEEMEETFTPKEFRLFVRMFRALKKRGHTPEEVEEFVSDNLINKSIIPAEVLIDRRKRKAWLAEIPIEERSIVKKKVDEKRKKFLEATNTGRIVP